MRTKKWNVCFATNKEKSVRIVQILTDFWSECIDESCGLPQTRLELAASTTPKKTVLGLSKSKITPALPLTKMYLIIVIEKATLFGFK